MTNWFMPRLGVDGARHVSATSAARLTLLACALVLPGCGGGLEGVEFQGKIFEVAGLTGAIGKREEPKTEVRSPLIMPPAGQAMAEPGSATVASAAPSPTQDPAWPQDQDQLKVANAEAIKKAQDAHCKDGNWKEKAVGDEIGADKGPYGRCSGSIFSVIGGTLFGQ